MSFQDIEAAEVGGGLAVVAVVLEAIIMEGVMAIWGGDVVEACPLALDSGVLHPVWETMKLCLPPWTTKMKDLGLCL